MNRVSSWLLRVTIEAQRYTDQLYRLLTGLPTLTHSRITPDVFIGGQYRLNALALFRRIGITGIINMRTKARYTLERHAPLRVLHLPTKDLDAPSLDQLLRGIAFIKQELEKGGKVYIHCHYGEGRGPSMGIAYLLSLGMTVEDAVTLVSKHRPFIRITERQLARLQEYSGTIEASSMVGTGE